MKPSNTQVLDIVEAIYRAERSDRAWIEGILAAAAPMLDRGLGLAGFPFEARESGLDVPWVKPLGTPAKLRPKVLLAVLAQAREDARVAHVYRRGVCETASEAGLNDYPGWEPLAKSGVLDFLGINGVDTRGHGVLLGAFLPRVTRLDPQFRERLTRVAAHLGGGQRYRSIVKGAAPEAVFSAGSKLLHAEGGATDTRARAALSRAVVALDRARGRQRRTDPDAALAAWKGLVAGRWSLVDEFESDGKRYVVARENEPASVPIAALSKREQQVVGYVAAGHSSKLIAYELGISDSTVRVLLSRAMQRLNVKTREALAARFLEEARRPPPDEPG